jgi:hypothetical protein
MQCRLLLRIEYALLLCALLATNAESQVNKPQKGAVVGLITDRLSSKQLKRWNAIRKLAEAQDASRRPLHPTLTRLLEWAENCGHAIYLDLPGPDDHTSSTAGRFDIEKFDPKGERHSAKIKLFLANIDQAYVGPKASRSNGFIPMAELNKEERYVEVLGHELAHAFDILSDLRRVYFTQIFIVRTNDLLLTFNTRGKLRELWPEMRWLLLQRDSMLFQLEAYAEEIEEEVWRELIASRNQRDRKPQ